MKLAVVFSLVLGLAQFSLAVDHNDKLQMAMGLIGDANSALGAFAKMNPNNLDPDPAKAKAMFPRNQRRIDGMLYMFAHIQERIGSVVDGKFVKGDMTPGIFLDKPVDQVEKTIRDFNAAIKLVTNQLSDVVAKEIEAQSKAEDGAKSFTKLKAELQKLGELIQDAHKAFKP